MRILNQLKRLKVIFWCLTPNNYHYLMGFERHKEIILQAVGTHLRMENICCLMARDHTGQVLGQGVSDLENTMHVHHPSSKILSCSTSLAIPMQTVLKPNKISMSIKKNASIHSCNKMWRIFGREKSCQPNDFSL